MKIWLFMLFIAVICPLIMIIGGIIFIYTPPKNINSIYGYRTEKSMTDYETWKCAHTYCGKLWLKVGTILLPFCIIAMLFVINKNNTVIGIMGLLLCVISSIALISTIFPTEKALGKKFKDDSLK